MHELLDLLTRHLAAAGKFVEHSFAIGASLIHHVAALLLGHLQFGFGIGGGILTAAGGLHLGFFAHALCFVGGLAKNASSVVFGAHLDAGSGLAGRGKNAGRLFAEQASDHLFVERHVRVGGAALRGAEFAIEEPLALLQARKFGGDHPKEVANLALFIPLTGRGERSRGHRVRRRGIGA